MKGVNDGGYNHMMIGQKWVPDEARVPRGAVSLLITPECAKVDAYAFHGLRACCLCVGSFQSFRSRAEPTGRFCSHDNGNLVCLETR